MDKNKIIVTIQFKSMKDIDTAYSLHLQSFREAIQVAENRQMLEETKRVLCDYIARIENKLSKLAGY